MLALPLLSFASLVSAWQDTDVLIQGFNWESQNYDWYQIVQNNANELQSAQFDMIWLPPPSDSASANGYLPRELYDLDSSYGSQSELISTINALNSRGIEVIADIVINHRVGTTDWADFTNPSWGSWSVASNDEWSGATGSYDTGDGYGAGRDLDHTNGTVQNDLKAWMNWLKNSIGFDGWRYDYVKGYDGYYNLQYNNATSPYFSVGEYWPDITGDYYASYPDTNYHRQILMDWIDATNGTSCVFDFTTKWQLQLALERNELWRMGSVPGAIGWWPARSVTFIDNHDTGSTQAHWPFPSGRVMEGYAYILTHPGIPCVFWDHYFDWGLKNEIKSLVSIRKQYGISSTSTISVQQATADVYAAIIDGHVAVKIGTGSWSPGSGWTLLTSGNNYAVWGQ